ncbi:MAG: PQQ-dependent sugar dehydrogenase [Opitutaceae bacterium]|nr:PQQ-dependent sugar dehydrogenase [Opitutaceae bacterium]
MRWLLCGLLPLVSALAGEAPANPWRTVARMPADNHDLAAAVTGGKLYVAGGVTNDYQGTGRVHAFDEIWELDARAWSWRAVAKFARPRIYCGTEAFDGRVWVAGGDELHADGQRRPSTLVEIYDPRTGALVRGPDLPVALPRPLALAAAGRLWVVGARDRTELGQFASIGPGETAWRVEPEALPKMWALAGAALGDRLYLCVPDTGLAEFDPATRAWRVIPGPTQPRSAQVAAWRGEIWIVGGVDITDRAETRIFNPAQGTWRLGPALPHPLAWGAAGVVNDQLVVTGGAWLKDTAEPRRYAFTEKTLALSADAIPPAPAVARGQPLPRWSDQKFRGTGGAPLAFGVEPAFPHLGLGGLTTIRPVPPAVAGEAERLLVMNVGGTIWTLPNRRGPAPKPDPFLDLGARIGQPLQAYSVAFHPRYPIVPHVFVLYNRRSPRPAENVLSRFTVTRHDPPAADSASEEVLLRWPSDGHNGGEIAFGPEGLLYVSIGDRSAPGDPQDMGQRVDLISGGVLRLDVDKTDPGKNYAVPPDNPFGGQPGVIPEFWAYGLRNPWRLAFGPGGELWTADNGDDAWESVHLVRRGSNHGWSTFEGSHPFKRHRPLAGPTPVLTPPIIELAHSEARSVVGGLVYTGKKFRALAGHYLFGDFVTGSVWAFRWDGTAPQNFRRIADAGATLLAFATDRDGEILLSYENGRIMRLVAAPVLIAPAGKIPPRLSETGLFASAATHTVAPGVIPYEISAPLWSDGANARRLLAISAWQSVTIDATADHRWVLPDGSAVARTLELPTGFGPRRVETQVMHRENGAWSFLTYAWNEAQTDAELVPAAGDTRPVPGLAGRTWRFAARNECTLCHTTATRHTLGLTTAQLNRDADFSPLGRRVENQIAALADTGMLKPAPAGPPAQSPRRVAPHDPAQPIEARVRSYLDANCAHCHRAGGVGGRAQFQLVESHPLAKTGLINGQPLVPLLGAEARIVTPGAPEKSELLHRMTLKTGGRMPLLGSEQPDEAGLALLRTWIAGLRSP